MTKCSSCGFKNKDHYLFCMECGEKLRASDEVDKTAVKKQALSGKRSIPTSEFKESIPVTRIARVCISCDTVLARDAVYCHNCGKKIEQTAGKTARVSEDLKTRVFVADEDRINPQLIHIKDNGEEKNIYDVTRVSTTLGRTEGDITFPTDTYMSPSHCEFIYEEGRLFAEDKDSFNGIFLKLKDRNVLHPGNYFLLGQQLLQFFPFNPEDLLIPPAPDTEDIINFYGIGNKKITALVKQIFSDRSEGNRYYVSKTKFLLGRQRGDIVFPDDKFMSNEHAVIYEEKGRFYLEDNNSSNGVFLQLLDRTELKDEDHLLIGRQLFQYRAPSVS